MVGRSPRLTVRVDDLNLYTYVQNDPIDLTDPEGTCSDIDPCPGDMLGDYDQQRANFDADMEGALRDGPKALGFFATIASGGFFGAASRGPGIWMAVKESMGARALAYQVEQGGKAGLAYVVNGVRFEKWPRYFEQFSRVG